MILVDKYWHRLLRRPYRLSHSFDSGVGETVVLLHGVASSGESWRYVIDEIDKTKHRVVALDLLGFGKSPQPNWLEYSAEDHARSVLLTLKRLRVKEPYILVGHSMGSLVAAEIAHKYPKKIKHLILHQMPMIYPEDNIKKRALKQKAYVKTIKFVAEHPRTTLLGVRALGDMATNLGGIKLTKDNWYPFEMSLRNTILKNANRQIHDIAMPTDVIYGKYDILVLKKNARAFFRPSENLRFYHINEVHRISRRSGRLIAELIAQDVSKDRTVSIKHAKLITPFTMQNKKAKKIKTTTSLDVSPDRRLYLLLAGLFGLAFLATASTALGGKISGWELDVFLAINNWQAPEYVLWIARVVSDSVWLVVVAVALSLLFKKYRRQALNIAVPTVFIYAVGYVLEHIINRARPDVLLQNDTIIRATQDGPGFVSGHLLAATAVVFILWPKLPTMLRTVAVLWLIFEAWSRVFLGVHFPLDVIGGVLLALSLGFALMSLPNKIRNILLS